MGGVDVQKRTIYHEQGAGSNDNCLKCTEVELRNNCAMNGAADHRIDRAARITTTMAEKRRMDTSQIAGCGGAFVKRVS